MKNLAPIILFVYNRPLHTKQTLEALMANDLAKESILYIYADGLKKNSTDKEKVAFKETRDILKKEKWCKEVNIIESDSNKGLVNSIINGVTEIVNRYGKVIVLEDDLITSKGFLKYMNDALNFYEDNEKVMHISAYMYPIEKKTKNETLFCNILSCWGWATWDRAWKNFNYNTDDHLKEINSLEKRLFFDIYGNADFYEQLLLNKKGVINSWAVKWYASWLYNGGYSLFPNQSLIKNIGHDGSGVHCNANNHFDVILTSKITVEKIPFVEDLKTRKEIDNYYRKIFNRRWYSNKKWYILYLQPLVLFIKSKIR